MRIVLILTALIFSLSSYTQVKVKGYYKNDGTYVKPHYRSSPDETPYNNYSYPGNTNPYTGKTATGNPNTYLKNYHSNPSYGSGINNKSNTYYSTDNHYSNRTYPASNYVIVKCLNVRAGPSASCEKIGSLSYSNRVTVGKPDSNGWARIVYSNENCKPWEQKTQIGYVACKYLSSEIPKYRKSYSSTGTSTYDYSSMDKKRKSPYGYGNGALVIWTNCGTDGEIKIYLNDIYVGKLTKYFSSEKPGYNTAGALTLNKWAGEYRLKAEGNNKIWESTIRITKDRCLIQNLNK